MSANDLDRAETYFAFGKNWADYSALIDDKRIGEAKEALLKLIPENELRGRSFLDIGCGSGLHALAAAHIGVSRILAIDRDEDSVAATHGLLSAKKLDTPWTVQTMNVFDLDPERDGRFDVVYSWGVLHHTGAMWEALKKAAAMVAPHGLLAIALYRKTPFDAFWTFEKRLYARAPEPIQAAIRAGFVAAVRLAEIAAGKVYQPDRGMDFSHDVHDWLGGYPYETASPAEVDERLDDLGFRSERTVNRRTHLLGLLGSGNDEYVYRRA